MTNTGPFLGIESSKIQFFTDTWQSFCQRLLRPANVTFWKKILRCPNLLNVLLPFLKLGGQFQFTILDFKVYYIEFEHPLLNMAKFDVLLESKGQLGFSSYLHIFSIALYISEMGSSKMPLCSNFSCLFSIVYVVCVVKFPIRAHFASKRIDIYYWTTGFVFVRCSGATALQPSQPSSQLSCVSEVLAPRHLLKV